MDVVIFGGRQGNGSIEDVRVRSHTGLVAQLGDTVIFFCLFNYTLFMFMFGALTTFTEWDNIRSTTAKKIKYLFTFPFFMLTYIPIALVALFKNCLL